MEHGRVPGDDHPFDSGEVVFFPEPGNHFIDLENNSFLEIGQSAFGGFFYPGDDVRAEGDLPVLAGGPVYLSPATQIKQIGRDRGRSQVKGNPKPFAFQNLINPSETCFQSSSILCEKLDFQIARDLFPAGKDCFPINPNLAFPAGSQTPAVCRHVNAALSQGLKDALTWLGEQLLFPFFAPDSDFNHKFS